MEGGNPMSGRDQGGLGWAGCQGFGEPGVDVRLAGGRRRVFIRQQRKRDIEVLSGLRFRCVADGREWHGRNVRVRLSLPLQPLVNEGIRVGRRWRGRRGRRRWRNGGRGFVFARAPERQRCGTCTEDEGQPVDTRTHEAAECRRSKDGERRGRPGCAWIGRGRRVSAHPVGFPQGLPCRSSCGKDQQRASPETLTISRHRRWRSPRPILRAGGRL
jgi:hypothetical protein